MTRQFSIGSVQVGGGAPLFLIAGPCVIEDEPHLMRHAEAVDAVARTVGIPWIFKTSYDKANRTSIDAYRGPGLREGLAILRHVKDALGITVLVDVHHPEEVGAAAEVADCLQVPAFLCRQTDLVVEAARSGRALNLKKGQFMAPADMKFLVEKATRQGNERVFVTERGSTFGYGNLVVDMRAIPWMQGDGIPVVFDATHSVQLPGAAGGASGGMREMAPVLARAAVAAGCDGVFLECHEEPGRAPSDGTNMLQLSDLEALVTTLSRLRSALFS